MQASRHVGFKVGDFVDIFQKKGWWQSEVVTINQKRSITVLVSASGAKATTKNQNVRRTVVWENNRFQLLECK